MGYSQRPVSGVLSGVTLWVRSGVDGALLDQHELPAPSGVPGAVIAAGHVDAGGCVLVPQVGGFLFLIGVATNGTGEVSITASNPGSVFTGLSLYHQFWFADPAATAGASASNGLREIFK